MQKIYIDSEFKCHVEDDGTMQAVETDYFDGKCLAYIEGYRYIPEGETWIREDGEVFCGEMVSPWKGWQELDAAQGEYEREHYQTLATENEKLSAKNATLEAKMEELDKAYQEGVDSL